jgi:hypothetical protein
MKILLTLSLSLIIVSSQVNAHHSYSASFVDTEIMREGVVNRYIFKNPHVLFYMTVTDEGGEETEWMVEGSAATSLRSAGWSNETIQLGEHVRITGRAGRDNKPMISMGDVEVLDPETRAVLRNPAVRGFPAEQNNAEIISIPLLLADGRPNLGGAWGRGRGGPSFRNHRAPPFNEAGIALQALWDPADDPQVACENPTLVRQAGFTPHPVRIEQFDDHVVVSYEEYGGVRTIYLDGRDAGGSGDGLVKLGRSSARYEGNALIIESTHIPAGPTGTPGNQLSDQTTVVETFRRLDDPMQGPMVEMEMIINDPTHLYEPWEMVWKKLYTESYEFIAVECHAPY